MRIKDVIVAFVLFGCSLSNADAMKAGKKPRWGYQELFNEESDDTERQVLPKVHEQISNELEVCYARVCIGMEFNPNEVVAVAWKEWREDHECSKRIKALALFALLVEHKHLFAYAHAAQAAAEGIVDKNAAIQEAACDVYGALVIQGYAIEPAKQIVHAYYDPNGSLQGLGMLRAILMETGQL